MTERWTDPKYIRSLGIRETERASVLLSMLAMTGLESPRVTRLLDRARNHAKGFPKASRFRAVVLGSTNRELRRTLSDLIAKGEVGIVPSPIGETRVSCMAEYL